MVMDVFTDVDIFRDLLDVGFKKKVSVYILLERTSLPHFLSMCQRANMHTGHLKVSHFHTRDFFVFVFKIFHIYAKCHIFNSNGPLVRSYISNLTIISFLGSAKAMIGQDKQNNQLIENKSSSEQLE